jgi:hypothetical protein
VAGSIRNPYKAYAAHLFVGLTGSTPSGSNLTNLATELALLQWVLPGALPHLGLPGGLGHLSLPGGLPGKVLGLGLDMQVAGLLLALQAEGTAGAQLPQAQGSPQERVAAYYQDLGLKPDAFEGLYAQALGVGVPDSLVLALIASEPTHQLAMIH